MKPQTQKKEAKKNLIVLFMFCEFVSFVYLIDLFLRSISLTRTSTSKPPFNKQPATHSLL